MAREQVLVVEDNETSMKLFRDVLLATGYRPLEATTGARHSSWPPSWRRLSSSWTSSFPTSTGSRRLAG